ncbi:MULTISPECIES: nuclear transport factor 2 family protein [Geodermatophilus]|uniref:SnoaL-like domain-containing protein n=2 Tax=Geodermatophilus TaxID=1860 RepID=A0A1I7D7Y3_9ACTN|nr:nuclear transport factor 2 family protein [Geodermatophilus amargosae]NEM07601.1 nuclear transport factor 2 family protein [Geodermatophilus normandii]SFU07812.1 SnoaL-like domain-containing protein [Geodermatophilus amargosae]
MHNLTERFTAALHHLDAESDPQPLVDLTGDEAELVKLNSTHEARGREGAQRFWEDYRHVFGELETTFTSSTVGEKTAALEWESRGTLRSGKPFSYRGVTVIEGDGSDDGLLTGVRTYYDSAAFLQETAGTA